MARTGSSPKNGTWYLPLIGLGFVVLSYLFYATVNASVTGNGWPLFAREGGFGLAFSFLLLLLTVYLIALLVRHKHLEEALVKYQAGMDASIDGISILNDKYACVYSNSSYASLYGYHSHTELRGEPWNFFYSDREFRRFEKDIFPLIQKNGKWRGESVGKKRDGTLFPQDLSLTEMVGTGIVCIVRDVTDRKSFEEELQRKTLELSSSNRELEAFGYSLSHDLRNYLTRSSSATQILQESGLVTIDGLGQHLVRVISESNRDMEELVTAMLNLSQISRREMRRERVDLSEMVRTITAQLALSAPEREALFEVAPDVVVSGDPQMLKIALENLLGNAWKYSSQALVTRIAFGMVEHNGTKALFVGDNGIGFDMKGADRLFEPFQRLHNANGFSGTGIGLATVRRIIQRHGWEAWGEGESGSGATFYITFAPDLEGGGAALPIAVTQHAEESL